MDSRYLQSHAASARTRRLGIDGGDLMAGLDEGPERGHREIGRAHEDDAQNQAPARASFCALANFLTIRSRLSFER